MKSARCLGKGFWGLGADEENPHQKAATGQDDWDWLGRQEVGNCHLPGTVGIGSKCRLVGGGMDNAIYCQKDLPFFSPKL